MHSSLRFLPGFRPQVAIRESGHLRYPVGVLVALVLVQALTYTPSEPFFNNDETRHVMTGVFFRDVLVDMPYRSARDYAMQYYAQYPALGLLAWPPLFYLVEGIVMVPFGTSVVVAKVLVVAYAGAACLFFFLLVRWTHDTRTAGLAAVLLAGSPQFLSLSRQVMLEVPTLALTVAATYYFVRYLDSHTRQDLWLACIVAALAALTRQSAAFLPFTFLGLLFVRRQWSALKRSDLWVGIAVALLLVVPFYAVAATYITAVQFETMFGSIGEFPGSVRGLRKAFFYPSVLPTQIGWYALPAALAGLVAALRRGSRQRSWPYLLTIGAVYCTFSAMTAMESRYVIYWLPAFSLFAADALVSFADRWRAPGVLVMAFVVVATLWTSIARPVPFVRGYRDAAAHVLAQTGGRGACLFDGYLDGNFIYQIRTQDSQRRLRVLRGDKLLYQFHLWTNVRYRQFVEDEDAVLDLIRQHSPEFIVIEEPQLAAQRTAGSDLLRHVLRKNPQWFVREVTFPVQSNVGSFKGVMLEVYRSDLPE